MPDEIAPEVYARNFSFLEDNTATSQQFINDLYDQVWRVNEAPSPKAEYVHPSVTSIFDALQSQDPRDEPGEILLKQDADGNSYLYVPPLSFDANSPQSDATAGGTDQQTAQSNPAGEPIEALLFRPSRFDSNDQQKLDQYLDKFAVDGVDRDFLREHLTAVMSGNMDVLATLIGDPELNTGSSALGAFYEAMRSEGFKLFGQGEATRGLGPSFDSMTIIPPGETEGVHISYDYNTKPENYQAPIGTVRGARLVGEGENAKVEYTYPTRQELAQRVQLISRLARR